jgi:hypothetical protein
MMRNEHGVHRQTVCWDRERNENFRVRQLCKSVHHKASRNHKINNNNQILDGGSKGKCSLHVLQLCLLFNS